jgi:phosphoribosylaminoimidazole-succinocarboxamide synthase
MGSVKDLIVKRQPTQDISGIARFIFSDRYSIFDWGEMPDHIQYKGISLCIIGAYFFEKLEDMGIKTHYIGVVENEKIKRLSQLKILPDGMEIKLLRVLCPEIRGNEYDYSIYSQETTNHLIPLEIIYRNYLPAGSSVFKRLEEGSLSLKDIGLTQNPVPGQKLEKSMVDFSTKLEHKDRYINCQEAKEIANLQDSEIQQIIDMTNTINKLITQETEKIGLINEDGKIEFGFDENRNLIVVDVIGTPDECRFTYNTFPVSKEITRIFYRNTTWYNDIEKAKAQDKIRWKNLVSSSPPCLPAKLVTLISYLYQSIANELTERVWFNNIPSLQDILTELKHLLNK